MRTVSIACILLLFGCQNNEADFPEMLTDDAQQIGSNGVVMGGQIKEIGPVRPVYFGFLWDTDQDVTIVTSTNKYIMGSTSEVRKFSIQLSNLFPGTVYYYRSFSANSDYSKIYYGNLVSFTTLP